MFNNFEDKATVAELNKLVGFLCFLLTVFCLFLALQHAGKHMEDCIVASYTALLLGCLCQESPVSNNSVLFYVR